jgi:SEC-C motif-containing protein
MKLQRNAPCSCGSGKKYKRCCLPKERGQAAGGSAWNYAGQIHRIRHADDYPVEACYVNNDWKERGLARVVVSRGQENGKAMVGVFLVDVFCLGVKDAFCNEGLTTKQIENELLAGCYQNQDSTRIGIDYAKEIIYGAVDYARNLGFEPHPDFELSRLVLGTEEFSRARGLQFGGPQGKPLYVAGPDDDAPAVLRKLREKLGEDGFEFISPAADWEAIEEEDDDRQLGLGGRIISSAKKPLDAELKTYKQIRQTGMYLMSRITKTLPKELILQAASDLRCLDKAGRIVCDTEDELSFIMDRAIHDIPWPKQRWIEIYYRDEAAKLSPDLQAHLKAHIQPVFSLYEVSKKARGRGVWLVDLFRPKEFFLTDTGLGTTAEEGWLLASRIIHLNGVYFTSGVSTPFGPEHKGRLMSHFASLDQDKEGAGSWETLIRRHAPYFFIEFKKTGVDVEFRSVT